MRRMREWRLLVVAVVLACVAVAAGPATTTVPTTGDAVLGYLDRVIDWYRQVVGAGEAVGSAQELVAREGAREDARRVVGLAFDFGRAAAAMAEANGATVPATTRPGASRGRTLAQLAAGAEDRVVRLQSDVARVDGELKAGAATTRPAVTAERDRLAAQLELAQAQRDVLKEYAGFVTTAEGGGDAATLARKVEDLAASVPEVREGGENATPQEGQRKDGAENATQDGPRDAFQPETAGVFALVSRIFTLSGRMSELSGLADQARRLREECERIRGPIRDQIIAAVRRGEVNGAATQAVQDPAAVVAETRQLSQVAARFRQLAAAGVPLGEQEVLLDGARQNLLNWRAALAREHAAALKYLLLRLGIMAGVILALVVVSELWRRATFRYIQDVRRRRQVMFVRRVVVAGVVALIVTAGVVTEFGSLATFAGLITAGVAVALQAVILSGVAYFFFIGRFGVRVGDRVTIGGITGDVVEVGILRLYLAELAGKPSDLHPTGRIVVFSNSVLFQPQAFYKQMPGANYAWHEVSFTLSPEMDVRMAERRLVGAVERVYAGYKDSLERGKVLSGVRLEEGELRPEGRLRLTEAGVELVVRYPVEVKRAAEEDDRMTRELLAAIEQEPKLKLAAGGRMIQPA